MSNPTGEALNIWQRSKKVLTQSSPSPIKLIVKVETKDKVIYERK